MRNDYRAIERFCHSQVGAEYKVEPLVLTDLHRKSGAYAARKTEKCQSSCRDCRFARMLRIRAGHESTNGQSTKTKKQNWGHCCAVVRSSEFTVCFVLQIKQNNKSECQRCSQSKQLPNAWRTQLLFMPLLPSSPIEVSRVWSRSVGEC